MVRDLVMSDSGHGGVDEVGRGAWAGPLAVGIVVGEWDSMAEILHRQAPRGSQGERESTFYDSKALSPTRRIEMARLIREAASEVSVGVAEASEIDALGLTRALRLATDRALAKLSGQLSRVYLDGKHNYTSQNNVITGVRADVTNPLVAGASIVAKVERDHGMAKLAEEIPYYDFESNKGYPSQRHISSLHWWGPSSQHRRSWASMRGLLYAPLADA